VCFINYYLVCEQIWDKLGFPTAFLGYTWSLMRTRNLPLPKGRDLTKRKSSADEGKEAKKPTAQWIFSTSTLSLEEVKKVKRVSLSRFLNILASVEVSALRRFLLERGSRLDSELPHNLWVSHLHEESHEELRNSVLDIFYYTYPESPDLRQNALYS